MILLALDFFCLLFAIVWIFLLHPHNWCTRWFAVFMLYIFHTKVGIIQQSIINRYYLQWCHTVCLQWLVTCHKPTVVSTYLQCKTVSSNCCCMFDETSVGGTFMAVMVIKYSLAFSSIYLLQSLTICFVG